MAKQVQKPKDTKAKPAKEAAFQEAPPAFGRRVTLDLTDEDHQALKLRALEQRTNMATLLRSMVRLYLDDPKVARKSRERKLMAHKGRIVSTRKRKRSKIDPGVPKAGPVTITRADGTSEVRPAMTRAEASKMVRRHSRS